VTDFHDPHLLDYAIGLPNAPTARATEAHLRVCPSCRRELQQLREVDTALRRLPPELFLDGPPQGGELALQRAMRQVRDEKTRHRGAHRGPRRTVLVAAAATIAALVGGGSWLIGHQAGVNELTGQVTALPAGTHVSASSPVTGVRLSAVITPAPGWVRVTATVTGIPAGEQCNLVVVDRAGVRHIAAGWLASASGQTEGTTVTGSTVVAPADVAAVAVQSVAGREVVLAPA
jgi:hypothetical protein